MNTFKFSFKSIKVNNIEKPVGNTGRKTFHMEFDVDSIQDHLLQLNLKQIFINRVWIINFFLAAMIIFALFAFLYGILVIGFKINFASSFGETFKIIYIILLVVSFFIMWSGLSIPGSVQMMKKEFVENKRGEGNWKIVDEKKWEKFYRLLAITKQDLKKNK